MFLSHCRTIALLLLAWISMGAALAQTSAAPGSSAPQDKHVLILVTSEVGGAGIDNFVHGMLNNLSAGGVPRGNIYVEYLSLNQNAPPKVRTQLAAFLREKYASLRIEAINTIGQGAVNFLLSDIKDVAPSASVYIHGGVLPSGFHDDQRAYAVMSSNLDYNGTLRAALQLFPNTRNVLVLSGSSETELARLDDVAQDLAPWEGKLEISDTRQLSMDEILQQVAHLPPDSIVMGVGIRKDAKGHILIPSESMEQIAKNANRPVFVVFDTTIGRGPVGGMVTRFSDDAAVLSQKILGRLHDEAPAPGGVTTLPNRFTPMFDWRSIERWSGDTSALPAGAVVINRPLSVWEQYRAYVLGSGLVIVTLLLLVGSLLVERRSRRAAEADLKAGEERFRVLVENAPEAILVYDVDAGVFVDANPNAEKLLGCSLAKLLQSGPEPFFGAGMTDGRATPDTLKSNNQRALAGQPIFTVRDVLTADGRKLVCEARIVRLPTKKGNHVRVSLTDITDRRRAEATIEQLAFYDVLTSLPNRRLLHERLQRALMGCVRGQVRGALLYLDLDNFKVVNDTLGHEKGDQLLLEVAKRLHQCIREVDTAARLGGDEFVVMLEDLNGDAREAGTQALGVGEKILAALVKPYLLDGKEYRSSASIGVTLFEASDENADELLKRADLAMYQAKAAGRNTLRFFNSEMQAAVTARANLESDLRNGLVMHQFQMYLQPQVDTCGRTTGAEALMRWEHPTRGMVSPIDFINVAEDTGLIVPMGEWILETACNQLVAWATHDAAELTLSVNVSVRQFRQLDFVGKLLGILDRTHANPARLKLELTETMLVENVNATIAKMKLLRAHGVGFSIDDFGTGYSSLSYLKHLPLDQLKIDQSFVRDMLTDDSGAAIARAVITLGDSMGMAVIAEGVETQEQRDFLELNGCRAYQGYFFSRPLSQAAFAHYLAEQRSKSVA